MNAYAQGYRRVLKLAGLADDLRNKQREFRGEETDADMIQSGALTGLGAAMTPSYLEDVLGLQRVSHGSDLKALERLTDYYAGPRLPVSTARGIAEAREQLAQGAAQLSPEAVHALKQKPEMLQGPWLRRTGNVLGEAITSLPAHARRSPFRFGLGVLGATAIPASAARFGKGIYERNFADRPVITPQEAALLGVGLGGVGALGAAGYGVHRAHQQGRLPSINIEMPPPPPEPEAEMPPPPPEYEKEANARLKQEVMKFVLSPARLAADVVQQGHLRHSRRSLQDPALIEAANEQISDLNRHTLEDAARVGTMHSLYKMLFGERDKESKDKSFGEMVSAMDRRVDAFEDKLEDEVEDKLEDKAEKAYDKAEDKLEDAADTAASYIRMKMRGP